MAEIGVISGISGILQGKTVGFSARFGQKSLKMAGKTRADLTIFWGPGVGIGVLGGS